MTISKTEVHDFWEAASCGEQLYLAGPDRTSFEEQSRIRYALEPYIIDFARFGEARSSRLLEIGVGLGADHQRFAEAGADLYGVDLTERAIGHTSHRFSAFGLHSNLQVADAEHLPFDDAFFDRVYSWGVLHHSPDTPQAISEVWRVLRPGGSTSIMIYHKRSLVGFMLWLRYGALTLRPWLTMDEVYSKYLESPGTKAYTVDEARDLFARFSNVRVRTVLTHGDLLESAAGQRHTGPLLSLSRRIWPRWLIRRLFPGAGLFLLIDATR